MSKNENNESLAPVKPSLNVKLPVKLYYGRINSNDSQTNQSLPPLDYSKTQMTENQICNDRPATQDPKPTLNLLKKNSSQMSTLMNHNKDSNNKSKQLTNNAANTSDKEVRDKNIMNETISNKKLDKNRKNSNLLQILQTTEKANDDSLINRPNEEDERQGIKEATCNVFHDDRNNENNTTAIQTDKILALTSEEYEIFKNMIHRNENTSILANQTNVDDNVIDLDCAFETVINETVLNIHEESRHEAVLSKPEQYKILVKSVYGALINKIIKPAFEQSVTLDTTIGSNHFKRQEKLKSILGQTFATISECIVEFLTNKMNTKINSKANAQPENFQTGSKKSNRETDCNDEIKILLLQNTRLLQEIQKNVLFVRQLFFDQQQNQQQFYGTPQLNNVGLQRTWDNNNPSQLPNSNPTQGQNVVANNSQIPVMSLDQTESQTRDNDYTSNKNIRYGQRQHPYGNQIYTTARPQRPRIFYNTPHQQHNQTGGQQNNWQSQDMTNRQHLPDTS